MAIINYTDQLKYAGRGYLDAKMMPVQTVDDLKAISLTQRFEGLTITVLNDGDGIPHDYWLVGGVTNQYWTKKTVAGDYKGLKLILEDGFLKLLNGNEELGDSVNLNEFFPEKPEDGGDDFDLYISSVDYTLIDDNGNEGVFLCFTYSDDNKKYLNMSQFLSQTYESGSGIVIDGNVISLDDAILGRIEKLELDVTELHTKINEEISNRKDALSSLQERIEKLSKIQENVQLNSEKISGIESSLITLEDKVNALSSAGEGLVPDGETIGITKDASKALFVKILEKEGNILKKDVNENGENGLYASIPVFFEDEEL